MELSLGAILCAGTGTGAGAGFGDIGRWTAMTVRYIGDRRWGAREISSAPWDYYKVLAHIKGEDAFGPPNKECSLVK